MRQIDRKYPSVKVRLAPLPIKNLSFGNPMNLEECLNRSVSMDRPASRMSDVSNFSANSMISVARSNYENQSDELRRQLNRNLMETLRSKDIRRNRNHLNNRDSYSVDLNFKRNMAINHQQINQQQQQIKRKRDIYDDDEESELDYDLFNKNNKTTKFARTNLQIPSKNRFVSSQYKNNEITSSYYSINNQLNNNNRFNTSNKPIKRSLSNQDLDNKKIFKVPLMIHPNSSSKENKLNVSNSINLSNSSISPINKKNISNDEQKEQTTSINSNSNTLLKSLDNSSNEMSIDSQQSIKNNSNCSIDSKEDKNEDSFTEIKNKNNDIKYKIPEHFHTIDDHKYDERKLRDRVNAFLSAINSFLPYSNKTNSDNNLSNTNNNELNNETKHPQTTSTVTNSTNVTSSNLFPSVSSTLTTTNTINVTNTKTDTINTKTTESTTQFKLPTILSTDSKSSKTSTPLKVTFNLPNTSSTADNTIQNTTTNNDNSSIFKFGQTATDNQNKTTEKSATAAPIFKFGGTNDLSKPKEITDTKPMFAFPTTSTVTSNSTASKSTEFNLQNFSFNNSNKETTGLKDSSINSKTTFPSLSTATNFTLPTVTTNSTSNSIFTFGANSQPKTASTDKKITQDLDKPSSSFVFKFGNTPSTTASTTSISKPVATNTAPAFNFGQSTNLQAQQTTSASGFNFNSSVGQNNLSVKPTSTAFTFGNLNTSQQIDQSLNKPANQSLNFSFTSPTENRPKDNAGYNFNLNANLNNSTISNSKPAFNFGAPASSFSSQATSTPFKFDNNNLNPSSKPSSINFNFGLPQTNQQKPVQNTPSFNFTATATAPNSSAFQFGAPATNKPTENSFTSSAFQFNSTASKNNIFTIGRK